MKKPVQKISKRHSKKLLSSIIPTKQGATRKSFKKSMRPIKSSATKRKDPNTMPTDPEVIREVVREVLVASEDLVAAVR